MTSSTKLCCMSVGSDSLASDNHTATGKGGGALNRCIFCACVASNKWEWREENSKKKVAKFRCGSMGAFACRCLKGNRASIFPVNPWGTPQRSIFAPKQLFGFMSRWGESGKIFKYRGPECPGSANETVRFTGFIVILILSVPPPKQSLTGRLTGAQGNRPSSTPSQGWRMLTLRQPQIGLALLQDNRPGLLSWQTWRAHDPETSDQLLNNCTHTLSSRKLNNAPPHYIKYC